MTRRIAFAILLTVWAILIAGGVLTYFVTRSVLLDDLADTLLAQVLARPEIEPAAAPRTVIRVEKGGTIARSPALPEYPAPEVLDRHFSRLADGSLIRTLDVRAYQRRVNPLDPPVAVRIIHTGSAARFDQILRTLIIALAAVGLGGGLLTAAIARTVARAALKPMINTAAVIGEINENSLDRRIDVTQLPRELLPVGLKLNEMLDRLQSAFSQRKQFLADASHELRTPVAALVTTLEVTLARSRNQAEYDRALQTCLTDAQLLKSLVESLLEQVRSERFSADGRHEPVNLTDLLGRCGDLADTLGAGKQIRVQRKIESGLVLISNEARLRSVFINLLSNAVEYNRPGGSIEIVATRVAEDESGNDTAANGLASRVRIEIRDTGAGIASEDLKHVFEPFYRADKVRSHDTPHLGLGLFLVKTHVEALGGVCRVESQPGVGTTFRIEVPSAVAEAAAHA